MYCSWSRLLEHFELQLLLLGRLPLMLQQHPPCNMSTHLGLVLLSWIHHLLSNRPISNSSISISSSCSSISSNRGRKWCSYLSISSKFLPNSSLGKRQCLDWGRYSLYQSLNWFKLSLCEFAWGMVCLVYNILYDQLYIKIREMLCAENTEKIATYTLCNFRLSSAQMSVVCMLARLPWWCMWDALCQSFYTFAAFVYDFKHSKCVFNILDTYK